VQPSAPARPAGVGRSQTRPEEMANALSHGLGLAAAVGAGLFLLVTASQHGDSAFRLGAAVYVATGVALYLASSVYHALPAGRAKTGLWVCDHAAIYLFIAGTYTPFLLGVLRGPWCTALLIALWTLALAGVAFKIIGGPGKYPRLSTSVYVGMGWIFLLMAGPVWRLIAPAGLAWLLAGGAAYTMGVAFYRWERLHYAHFIWHLFVLAGTVCHFIAVWRFAG